MELTDCSLHKARIGLDSTFCNIISIRHDQKTVQFFLLNILNLYLENLVTLIRNKKTKTLSNLIQQFLSTSKNLLLLHLLETGTLHRGQTWHLKLQSPHTTLCLQGWRRVSAMECLHLAQRMGSSVNSLWRAWASEVHCLLAPDLLLKKVFLMSFCVKSKWREFLKMVE